ncbi:MAG: topoisomerase DNA-binding C4 zinc finger domain-containing protein [Pirellulaceae bacterium]
MTKLLIEYLRPNGEPLRFVDLGTAFMESEKIPLSNALRPVRDEADERLSKRGNVFFDFARCEFPLPDGLNTVLRIRGTTVSMNVERLSEAGNPRREGKTFVVINDVNYEVAVFLTKGRNPFWVKVNAHKASRNATVNAGKETNIQPTNSLESIDGFAPSNTLPPHQPTLPFMWRNVLLNHCPKCGSRLVRKQITVSRKVRHFMACSSFPECRFTRDA